MPDHRTITRSQGVDSALHSINNINPTNKHYASISDDITRTSIELTGMSKRKINMPEKCTIPRLECIYLPFCCIIDHLSLDCGSRGFEIAIGSLPCLTGCKAP